MIGFEKATLFERSAALGHLGPIGAVLVSPPPPPYSIALWRGFVSAQFYLRDPQDGAALAFSPTLRTWRFPWQERKPLYEDTEALAALAALRADLVSKGWERMRRASGSEWYELRFRRTGSDDPGSSDRRAPARRSRRAHGSPNGSTGRRTTLVEPKASSSAPSR
jgi:hypothetical protein